jgi:hypothetical protein
MLRHRGDEDVVFRLSNLRLENVPFSSKKISVRFHRYLANLFTTRPADVDDSGTVHWPDPSPFQDRLSRSVGQGQFLTRSVDVFISIHDPQRGNRLEDIAEGKLDLAQLASDGSGPVEFPLQSQLLSSPLRFDLEALIGNARIESKRNGPPNRGALPELAPVLLPGTFRLKHSPEQVDIDANLLAAAARLPPE